MYQKLTKAFKALNTVRRKRGLGYTFKLLNYFAIVRKLNPFAKEISSMQKELFFQEKQIIGMGDFSGRMKLLMQRETQKRMFPEDLLPFFLERVEEAKPKKLTVLDVGSGLISFLSYGQNAGLFDLIAADVLSEEYKSMLEIYGYDEVLGGTRLIQSPAEQLDKHMNPNSCDIVHCSNALDHTNSPRHSLENMVKVVRPQGHIIITARSHEGTHEGWEEIHQHDLYLKDNILWRSGKDGVATSLLEGLPLSVVYANDPEGFHDRLVIILRHEENITGLIDERMSEAFC